ncbi:unnamed protein product [Rotaria magnacalcarata]|uniref:Uncharacterized protein n=1 Tax=Rotaria magnacalcarata TaxID=392030 RepID=A0A816FQB1_9BILA|nr:unnamed protein product [Rotaria magnacalcarata]CAF1664387.1 unnamed protein product [Rotaria magnacalcarata]CAF2014967.1 unnamed protein product [Rotaria magnacalcarata]CAF2054045.1 unnamed protein product [Rotaria magnacalcarata]CAF3946484.1 unnamed protein product [Rotaria magnacalcarata]
MASGSNESDNSKGKKYSASEFRASFSSSASYSGEVRRHKFDCELAAAAATRSPGPRYSDKTIKNYAKIIASSDNIYDYGSAAANYGHDRSSVKKVLESVHTGKRVVLSSHEASHIREGAAWLASHKNEFSEGFINSAASLYENVYDQDEHKVVDRRTLKY